MCDKPDAPIGPDTLSSASAQKSAGAGELVGRDLVVGTA
jgi:hypothetical protein